MGKSFFTESKTTKLGFEDIGELATQTAYSSNVSVIDRSRNLWGLEIPFTQSKYVFSYDTIIKAGLNFTQVKWSVNEKDKVITVLIPEVKILSNEIDPDSLKVYYEAESIFTNIGLEDTNEAQKELKDTAQKTAIENGLLKNAETNAQALLEGYIAQVYDINTYDIQFKDLEDNT